MTWRAAFVGILMLAVGILGCRQKCFMSDSEFEDAHALGLPPHLECDPSVSAVVPDPRVPPPTTVTDPSRNPRFLTLREAIAIALENGTVGGQSATSPGFASDVLPGFTGLGVSTDSIRVLALNPAIEETSIEASLSKFDVQWNNSLTWTRTQNPTSGSTAALLQQATTGGQTTTTGGQTTTGGVTTTGGQTTTTGAVLPEAINTDTVNASTGLIKPLPTGGVAGITFMTNYTHSNFTTGTNPAYTPDLQFSFEQPLLQGFGVEINQLRTSHPGSLLTPISTATGAEGILITRIRFDQQRAEFERNLNYLLLNVEGAYWNLYSAYYQLYSAEEGMRQSFELWRINQLLLEKGRGTLTALSQARVQYETFRGQRLTALGNVLESERQLRGLLNLPIEDGHRLVPVDRPALAPFNPDWKSALAEALARRPELFIAREDLKFRQLDVLRQKDNLLPDLRFFTTYDLHATGSQIDEGRNPNNAFHELVSDPLQNWSTGLRMNVPIGFRLAHSSTRASQLALAQSYLTLRTEEDKAQRFLGLAYRQLSQFHDQILTQEAAVRAATVEVQTSLELYQAGRVPQDTVILAQRDLTTAIASKYAAIGQYNNALATFEFAKGTIMQHDSVSIADGPLPHCVQVRAVEHERQRTMALVVKERPAAPVSLTAPVCGPAGEGMSLSAVVQNHAPVPEIPAGDHPPAQDDRSGTPAGTQKPAAPTPPVVKLSFGG